MQRLVLLERQGESPVATSLVAMQARLGVVRVANQREELVLLGLRASELLETVMQVILDLLEAVEVENLEEALVLLAKAALAPLAAREASQEEAIDHLWHEVMEP